MEISLEFPTRSILLFVGVENNNPYQIWYTSTTTQIAHFRRDMWNGRCTSKKQVIGQLFWCCFFKGFYSGKPFQDDTRREHL